MTGFDPAEFDTPPPAVDPGTEYRELLDAMRQAGAEGIARQAASLAAGIERDAVQRQQWLEQVRAGVEALDAAARRLHQTRLKEWIAAGLIGLGLLFAGALAYRWAQEPKIETRLYGCTTRWDPRTGTCVNGQWVPLQQEWPQKPLGSP